MYLRLLLFKTMLISVSFVQASTPEFAVGVDYGIVGHNQEAGYSAALLLRNFPQRITTELRSSIWHTDKPYYSHSMAIGYDVFSGEKIFSSLGLGAGLSQTNQTINTFYQAQLLYGVHLNKRWTVYNRNMMGFGKTSFTTGAVTLGVILRVR